MPGVEHKYTRDDNASEASTGRGSGCRRDRPLVQPAQEALTTALLIDDERSAFEFVRSSLPESYELSYASTLTEGERLAELHDYDVILVDLKMPLVENGDALTCMLKVSPASAVIVITSLHSLGYAVSLIRQGALWVTFKPDAALEPEIAKRLLAEAVAFAKARHDHQQQQLLSLSANAAAIEELRREMRKLRQHSERLAVIEAHLGDGEVEMKKVWERFDAQHASQALALVEREKGKWGMWAKVIGLVGTGLAAIIGPWAASRWGRGP